MILVCAMHASLQLRLTTVNGKVQLSRSIQINTIPLHQPSYFLPISIDMKGWEIFWKYDPSRRLLFTLAGRLEAMILD